MRGHLAQLSFLLMVPLAAQAWNYTGHRIVTAVAVASLPDDFPAFARSTVAGERAQFLSGEPDRWRNQRDAALRHINEPDHYFDLELLEDYGLTPETLPELRNDLIGRIYIEQARDPEKYPPPEPGAYDPRVRNLFGLLPYSINENYLKLKSTFATLAWLNAIGASESDIADAQQNAIYHMGILSHFVGDGAQPLHVTIHHHGWVGDNPNGFTRNPQFHSWIDGGFIAVSGITFDGIKDRVRPAALVWPGKTAAQDANAFPVIVDYLVGTHQLVEPLYTLRKKKKLLEEDPSPEGKAFIEEQLLRGGQFLGDLY
jgi:hypothetical protein